MGCVRRRRKCWGLLSPTLWTSNFTVQANARHSWRSYFCFVSCRFWHLHEPNLPEERCASVVHWNPTGWGWNNVFCKHKYNSICEMKKTYLWAAFYSFIPLESLGTNMWLFSFSRWFFSLMADGSFLSVMVRVLPTGHKVESPRKRDPQLRNCPIRLTCQHVCGSIFLIDDCCQRVQWVLGGWSWVV